MTQISSLLYVLQGVQLLVCDWLLTTRTAVWQEEQGEGEALSHVCQAELLAFQRDLTSLRRLAQVLKVAMPRVSLQIREA